MWQSYLEILLPVEDDGLGFHFSVFDVHLVTTQDNWDVLTDSNQISMPVGDILVSDSRCDIKHDDSTLALYTQ